MSTELASVVIAVLALAVISTAIFIAYTARRRGISTAALLVNALAGFVAPQLDGPGDLERAIARDRKKGPALPPRGLRQQRQFSDEHIGATRIFRITPRHQQPGLRLLYLHGGGYVLEVQSAQWNVISGLLKRIDAEVIAPVYPLAPEHGWEEGLNSVEQVFNALASEAGAENIVIIGDSAGGGLALALAQRLRDAGAKLPAALVLVSPWLDLGVTGDDQPRLETRDPALSTAFLRKAGGLWAKGLPLDDPRISPLFGNQTGLPPIILFSGGRDILASDCFRLAAQNPLAVHRHHPEMIHVWPAAPTPEGKQALDEMGAFIREHWLP